MRIAITRGVSPRLDRCEISHVERQPIDLATAREQHRRYEGLLEELGSELIRLPAERDLPDSVFVEDTAVVLDEIAVITRPGALSRRSETDSIAGVLGSHRPLSRIEPPGTLDGGDVLCVGRRIFVGLSSRTNRAAIEQLRTGLDPYGYVVSGVPVTGCLHLKSAVTQVAGNMLLVNRSWTDCTQLGDLELVEVDPSEPRAANALRIGNHVVCSSLFPRTRERLEERGIAVRSIDVSELAKAEAGVTCCSLIFERN